MEKLPQEIRLKIASFIPQTLDESGASNDSNPQDKLVRPGIAILSHGWQAAIEDFTFRDVHIKNTELATFISHFSTIRRRRCLREVYFDVVLPTYSDEACGEYETNEDRETNNEFASKAIFDLLRELSGWPSDLNIALFLTLYSPMDGTYRGLEKFWKDQHDTACRRRKDIFNARFDYSYIHLDASHLQVPCVRRLFPNQGTRSLVPSSLISLTTIFPNLSSISWNFDEPLYSALRKQLRDDFVDYLEKFELSSEIKTLHLVISSPHFPHYRRLPNLIGSCPNDHLSVALNRLMCRSSLEKFHYEGPLDSSLFWPGEHSTWEHLREIEVVFHHTSPSGQWYFKGAVNDASDTPLPASDRGHFPPGYGTQDDTHAALAFERSMQYETDHDGLDIRDDFRTIPNEEVIVPLLEAFARRLLNSPLLVYASLETNTDPSNKPWFVHFGAPGQCCGWEEYMNNPDTGLSETRIFFHVMDWRPSKDLLDLFYAIRNDGYEKNPIITFLPNLYDP